MKEEKDISTVLSLIHEINTEPEKAFLLVESFNKILLPWEPILMGSQFLGEMTVPSGQTPSEYKKNVSMSSVSGYVLRNLFSKEVVRITKEHPKWKVYINGVIQIDSPMISHGNKAELEVKKFAEDKVKEKGFIIIDGELLSETKTS